MREQVRDPHGVVHVALAPGHVLDVGRIGQHQLGLPLQDVPDRLPVDAGRLHRHVGTRRRAHPVREFEQAPGGRGEAPHLVRGARPLHQADARHDFVLVHIESRAALV